MKLTKCVNGHFYDEEKFESCPHCAGGSKLDVNAIFGGAPSAPKPAMSKIERDDDMTVPLDWTPAETPQKSNAPGLSTAEVPEQGTLDLQNDTGSPNTMQPQPGFGEDQSGSKDSVVTGEPEPFVVPDAGVIGDSEPFGSPDTEVTGEPEPFELPDAEVTGEPGPFASSDAEVTIEPEPFASVESNPSVGIPASWEMPQPNVEEIPVGNNRDMSGMADPELEDQPTEIVDEGEMTPFVSEEPTAEPEMGTPDPFVTTEPAGVPGVETPGPFVSEEPAGVPGVETPEPFVSQEPAGVPGVETPGPFVSEEPAGVPGVEAPGPFVSEEPAGVPGVEAPGPFVTAEPEMGTPKPFVPVEPEFGVRETAPTAEASVPTATSPAAAMFGASVNNDDNEHTVAFYDEIFVSKAPSAPVVPQAVETPGVPEAMPAADTAVPVSAPVSEPSVEGSGKEDRVAEPDVFTAPSLQPPQALPTPCVGWLIALNGSHIGQDFHLRVGKNYIGRDVGMDIALVGDKSVSRNKHAIVVYEPKHHKYFIQPGESNELVYVNDEVVLLPMPLKPYDLIVIGDIELWFMPLCDEQHNWSEVIRRLQEQMNPNVQ